MLIRTDFNRIRKWGALACLLPFLAACSLTSGSVYGGTSLSTNLNADPNLGPQQFASVSLPARTTIIGRDTAYLKSLIGEPSLKRTEQGAELWQYQSASCVALFYLYESEGRFTVTHYDARARNNDFGQVSEDLCLKEIFGTFGARKRA